MMGMVGFVSGYCTRRKWRIFREAVEVKHGLEKYADMDDLRPSKDEVWDSPAIVARDYCRNVARVDLDSCLGNSERAFCGGIEKAMISLERLDKLNEKYGFLK